MRPAAAGGEPLTVEHVTSFEPIRDVRLHPRDRSIAYVGEAAGANQIFVLPLRGGPTIQLTASEKAASDPQWSPDGRRIAFVRDGSIWVIDADGSREVQVTEHPASNSQPRWSPDGLQLSFVSRRRGWSQLWRIDAPVPRRGRPAAHPRPPEPVAITPGGLDVDEYCWSADGSSIAFAAQRPELDWWSGVSLVDVSDGSERLLTTRGAWECSPRWLRSGGVLLVSDEDGWFQVVRVSPDGRERTILTAGQRDHGDPNGSSGYAPHPSPDGARFVHIDVHDGVIDLVVAPLEGPPRRRPRGRPPKRPRPVSAPGAGIRINPDPGVWRAVDWSSDGAWIVAIGESTSRPADAWLLPVAGVARAGSRPRRLTDSLPAVLRSAHWVEPQRIEFRARDGLSIEGNLFRPSTATGRRGGARVPTVVYLHGGPTSQSLRGWAPFKQVLAREGFAVLDVDFRGSTGYGREFRLGNVEEWGHADTHDCIDAAHWATAQPWSDGRAAVFGGSYGGYLTLTALVEEPALWRAGVDLYGDSEIAESYRHGDRPGRLDLYRMMGDPDDPSAAPGFRRGSPVYRAERIEAPLLIIHGRKDKRVVPLMTEKMVEALTIEDKHHEVQWYDDEAHGWQNRANRRDSYQRIVTFLKRHVLDER